MKVDLSASDSSQGSTKKRRPTSKGLRKKRPTSRQPPTKSPAIYNEVQKDQVVKGRTSSQLDPYQSGGDGGSQHKLSRDKHQSDPVHLIPRGRVTKGGSVPHGTSPNWEAAGSLQRTVLPRAETKPDQALSHQEAQHVKSPLPISAELERLGMSCCQDPSKTSRQAWPSKKDAKRGEMQTAEPRVHLAMAKTTNIPNLREDRKPNPGTNRSHVQKEMEKSGVENVT